MNQKNLGGKEDGFWDLPGSIADSIFQFFFLNIFTHHSIFKKLFLFFYLLVRPPPFDPWTTPSGFTELPFSIVFSMFLLLCFLNYFKPSPLTILMHSQWKETVRKCVSHVGYTFHNSWWLRHTLHWASYVNCNKTLQTSWIFTFLTLFSHWARLREVIEKKNKKKMFQAEQKLIHEAEWTDENIFMT